MKFRPFLLLIYILMIMNVVPVYAGTMPSDSAFNPIDSLFTINSISNNLRDSLFNAESLAIDSLGFESTAEKYIPAVKIIDSLNFYFVRQWHDFDVLKFDLYPRDAAGFLMGEASYYRLSYHETPLRTTVAPFGLPGRQLYVTDGSVPFMPYDRTIPPDGMPDFSDFSTGDINRAGIIEGPLAALNSFDGEISALYMEPFAIPEGEAESQFIVERGAYGYAYTRGRLARMFGNRFGVAFSTDYRNGDGYNPNANDNSYYVKTRMVAHLMKNTDIESSIHVYRRKGNFPVMPDSGGNTFNRFRRDNKISVSITRHDFLGGQVTGNLYYQSSRSGYFSFSSTVFRTVKPLYYSSQIAYTKSHNAGVFYFSIQGGENKFDINHQYLSQNYGMLTIADFRSFLGGQQFIFARLKNAETDHPAIEGAIGWSHELSQSLKSKISLGYLTRFPTLDERYTDFRSGSIGSQGILAGQYSEGGNPGLQPEKKLIGNVGLQFKKENYDISVSANAGTLNRAIYYDRRFTQVYTAGEVIPQNDSIHFVDLNLSGSFSNFGPFYGSVSATMRKVESERYGNRPPYSPRWQIYGRLGIKYHITRYDIYLRFFGEMSHAEQPLSYNIEQLETVPLISWGVNASMQTFTFYYLMHNATGQVYPAPEGYGYLGWFYSWGINWKFFD
ncbi:MAG: TonB-dependent receptor [Candidatus Zixiibacteriota bacterium]